MKKHTLFSLSLVSTLLLSSCSPEQPYISSSTTNSTMTSSSETETYNGLPPSSYFTDNEISNMISDPNRYKIIEDDYDANNPFENIQQLNFDKYLVYNVDKKGFGPNPVDADGLYDIPMTPFNKENTGELKIGSTIEKVDKHIRDNKIFIYSTYIDVAPEFTEFIGTPYLRVNTISHNFYFNDKGELFRVEIMPDYWPETAEANLQRDDVIDVVGKPDYLRVSFMPPKLHEIQLVYPGDNIIIYYDVSPDYYDDISNGEHVYNWDYPVHHIALIEDEKYLPDDFSQHTYLTYDYPESGEFDYQKALDDYTESLSNPPQN